MQAFVVNNAFVQVRRLRQKTPVGEKGAAQTKSPGNRRVQAKGRGEPAVTPSSYRVGQGRSSTSFGTRYLQFFGGKKFSSLVNHAAGDAYMGPAPRGGDMTTNAIAGKKRRKRKANGDAQYLHLAMLVANGMIQPGPD